MPMAPKRLGRSRPLMMAFMPHGSSNDLLCPNALPAKRISPSCRMNSYSYPSCFSWHVASFAVLLAWVSMDILCLKCRQRGARKESYSLLIDWHVRAFYRIRTRDETHSKASPSLSKVLWESSVTIGDPGHGRNHEKNREAGPACGANRNRNS